MVSPGRKPRGPAQLVTLARPERTPRRRDRRSPVRALLGIPAVDEKPLPRWPRHPAERSTFRRAPLTVAIEILESSVPDRSVRPTVRGRTSRLPRTGYAGAPRSVATFSRAAPAPGTERVRALVIWSGSRAVRCATANATAPRGAVTAHVGHRTDADVEHSSSPLRLPLSDSAGSARRSV